LPYLPCPPKIFKNKVPKNHAKLSAAKITPNFRPKKSRQTFPPKKSRKTQHSHSSQK